MTPSWYDVLDVDPTAGAEVIRASWKSAIAELDPTDRRFRLLNQAAEVLLDPARRSEHDAVLAADPEGAASDPGGEDVGTAEGFRGSGVDSPAPRPAEVAGEERVSYAGWSPPAWLLAALAVLVAVVVTACAIVARNPADDAIEARTQAAQNAAEVAAVAVLSYDYRDMQASSDAASAYLTPAFRKDYDALFAQLEANAASVKPVVTGQVVSSGVERVSATGDRVSVLVFINRPTTNASTSTPIDYQDQVTMRMQRIDGDWLVDDMIASPTTQ